MVTPRTLNDSYFFVAGGRYVFATRFQVLYSEAILTMNSELRYIFLFDIKSFTRVKNFSKNDLLPFGELIAKLITE